MECARCQLIIAAIRNCRTNMRRGPYSILHRDAKELSDGVLAGCWWCVRIYENLTGVLKDKPLTFGHFAVSNPGFCTEFSLQYMDNCIQAVTVLRPKSLLLNEIEYVDFYADKSGTFKMRNLSYSTNSSRSWKFVEKRLKSCTVHHDVCRQNASWAPSRLVEISSGGSLANFGILSPADCQMDFRLVSICNHQMSEPYVTLSHRWGSGTHLKLVTDNLKDFKSRIPPEQMSQTYIDAAVATRRLGIRYIWIDSLCIIQDSPVDWEQESAQMGLVYQNGFCNLAASSALASSEGFFYSRDPLKILPYRSKLDNGSGGRVVFYTLRDTDLFSALDAEPLNKRGWVCQERLLATRNISFTKRLIYFECQRELSCEVGNASQHLSATLQFRGVRYPYSSLKSEIGLPKSIGLLAQDNSSEEYWRSIVQLYTECHLTVVTDRLVAISGVAKAFSKKNQARYLAGLWEPSLSRDLGWYCKPHKPKDDYQAPSWSWASHDSAVLYNIPDRPRELVVFINITTTPLGRNMLGTVSDGRITLRGFVFPVLSDHTESNNPPVFCPQDLAQTSRIEIMKQGLLEEDILAEGIDLEIDLDNELDDEDMRYFPPAKGMAIRGRLCEIYALPLLCAPASQLFSGNELSLLLLAAVTPSRGVYRRVGLCRITYSRNDKENPLMWNEHELPDISGLRPETFSDLSGWAHDRLRAMIERWRRNDVPSYERTAYGSVISII